MSEKDLSNAGVLLPEEEQGKMDLHTTVNKTELLLVGGLGIGACLLMYIGSGDWLTWVGVGAFFVFLVLFYLISIRGINKQNKRLDKLHDQPKQPNRRHPTGSKE